MFFIGLFPTLVVSLVAYITISSELTLKTADQIVSVASKQEQNINGMLQKRQEEAIEVANKYDLQTTLGEYLGSGGKQGRERLNGILLDKKVASPDIQTMYLSNLDGKVIATTMTGGEGTQLSAQDYQLAEGQETATTVREDARDGIDKLYITTKVSVNKQPAAYLSVIFRIDDIVAAVQDYTGLGATGETVVAEKDQSGNAISLFPLRFDTDAALKVKLNSLNLFSGFPGGYKEQTDYRGKKVIVAAKSIGFADWIIATKIDTTEALAQSEQLRNSLLFLVVVTSLAIVVIALYFTRFFTRPILRIAQAAQLIGHGDLETRINMQRRDEIGTLASSINAMGSSLKDFVASIELQRHRLEIILNSINESILAIDKQGRIIIANQAASELTQLHMEAIVGKNINEIFTWLQDAQPFPIDYSLPGTKAYAELQYTNSLGITHYVRLIVAKVSGEQEQKAAQTIVTIHDETKSRELENMKVDFVSMAAHELRTPLAAIRGYLELINFKAGLNISEDTDKYLKQALKGTSELGGLINNLLDVTRIERGTLALNWEKLDLAACVKHGVQDIRFTAEDKKIKISYNGPNEGWYIIGDQIAIQEVIDNLVSNAVKYTNEGGSVDVSFEQEGDKYMVRVKDTGIGIPQQAQSNLFTKFYRVHGGLNSGSTGTGLGLFISKSIIERHHGTIGFTSEEGVGSTFTFNLPVFDEVQFEKLQAKTQPEVKTSRRQRGWTTKNITR